MQGAPLAGALFDKYVGAVVAGLVFHDSAGLPTLNRAHDAIAKGISTQAAYQRREKTKVWKQLFREFTADMWRAASTIIHDVAECPAFTADEMTEEWRRIW